MRLLYIFVPKKVTCVQGICFSFIVLVIGSIGVSILANRSKLFLSIFTAVIGAGCGPLFANFMMWFESHVTVNNKVSASITIAGSVGGSVVPTLVGQVISKTPMFLMYVQVVLLIVLVVLFCASFWLGCRIKKSQPKALPI